MTVYLLMLKVSEFQKVSCHKFGIVLLEDGNVMMKP